MGPERHIGRAAEVREKPPGEKVRMFLFQSRTPDLLEDTSSIPDELLDANGGIKWEHEKELVARLDFTDMVLLRKNKKAVNAGELMPIGGTVEDGESFAQAIERETNEEAHLRTTRDSTIQLRSEQTYSFAHKSGKMTNHSTFFVGRLLPGDTPFPLDVDEDKIGSFERVPVKEYKRLFGDVGNIKRGGDTIKLLGSLQKNAEHRDSEKVDQHEVDGVHAELHGHFRLIEADKKMDVLKHLIQMRLQQAEEMMRMHQTQNNIKGMHITDAYRGHLQDMAHRQSDLVAQIREMRDSIRDGSFHLADRTNQENMQTLYESVVSEWQKATNDIGASITDVKIALDLSNTEASIENATNTKLDLDTGVGIPTITLFLPIILSGRFDDNRLKDQYLKIINAHPATRAMVRMLQTIDEGLADRGINDASVIEVVQKSGLFALTHGEYYQEKETISGETTVRTYSNILDSYFDRLFEEAGVEPSIPIHQLDIVKTENLPEGREFETLAELATGSHECFLDGNTPPEQHERIQWEAMRKLLLMQMLDQAVGIQQHIDEKGVDEINALEDAALDATQVAHRKKQREKTLLSLLRKMIVRDELSERVARDHFAETVFFEPSESEMDSITQAPPDGLTITDKNGKTLTSITAPPSMHDYFAELVREHEKRGGGGTLTIQEFKSPKKNGHESAGPGGGGDVFFWKWYIAHTDANGVERTKEVHAYASQQTAEGGIKTAQEFFDEKMADDQRYAVRRLFSTAGLRSFMELLFPAHIYGDQSRIMYKDVVSEKKYQKARQKPGS